MCLKILTTIAMKPKYIQIIFIALALVFNQAIAQEVQKNKSLKIGEVVPDISFKLVNSQKGKASLSEYRGKLVILDFWSTTCTVCIAQFSKLDSLQELFGDRIKLLLVNSKPNTREGTEKVRSFFERAAARGKNYKLETAVEDSTALELFKHQAIPHYVWIDQEGKFCAATSSAQVTATNILAILNGRSVNLRQKNDRIDFDSEKPLFMSGNGGEERNVKYKSTLTGYLDGVPMAGVGMLAAGKQGRLAMTNYSLRRMYERLFNNRFQGNRFVIDQKYAHLFSLPANSDDEQWRYDNLYCYELITTPTTKDSLLLQMKSDLTRYFGFTANTEYRRTKCMVITMKGKIKPTSQDLRTNISSVFDLKTFLDYKLNIPVVDETNYKEKIQLTLPEDPTNIANLKSELNKQGFDIVEKERELEMIVVSEIKK